MKKYAASDGRLLLAAAMIEVNEGGHRVTDNAHMCSETDGRVAAWEGMETLTSGLGLDWARSEAGREGPNREPNE
jgi:hypothetical protein